MSGQSVVHDFAPDCVELRFLSEATPSISPDLWPIGLVIVFIGSFCGALGDVMVRKAFIAAGEESSLKRMLRSPMWVFGMVLTAVLDPVTTLAALLFAPATVVTPFAGMHIFWGCFLAKFWLKEEVGYLEAFGSGLIIIGIVLVIVFAGKGRTYTSLNQYLQYTGSPQSIVYMVVCGLSIIITAVFSLDRVVNKLKPERQSKVQRVCLAGCSGLIGGNTNIAAKAFSVVAASAFSDSRIWKSYSIYLLLFLVAFFAISQLVFLNKGLRKFEAIYIVPTTNSFLITGGTIGSIMVLQEYPSNWGVFFFGLVLVVLGVTVLSYQNSTMWKILTCGGAVCKSRQIALTDRAPESSRGSGSFTEGEEIRHVPFESAPASPDSGFSLDRRPSFPLSTDLPNEAETKERPDNFDAHMISMQTSTASLSNEHRNQDVDAKV